MSWVFMAVILSWLFREEREQAFIKTKNSFTAPDSYKPLQNHIGREYAVCPFNARHEMPRPEIRHHIANCPDKALLEQDLAFGKSLKCVWNQSHICAGPSNLSHSILLTYFFGCCQVCLFYVMSMAVHHS